MRLRDRIVFLSPLVPALGGLALSIWQFKVDAAPLGLLCGLGGMLLMIVLACRVPDFPKPRNSVPSSPSDRTSPPRPRTTVPT